MLDAITDGVTKDVQNDLSNDKKEDAKHDVAQRPTILEGANNKNDLADEINEEKYGVDEVRDDKNADWVLRVQAGPILEGEKRNGASDDEHGQGGQSQQPDRQSCAVLVKLETNKPVDQQAGAESGREPVLDSGEVGVCGRARRGNACIKNKRYDGQEEVDVEEGCDFFAACVRMSVLESLQAHAVGPTYQQQ